MQTAPTARRRKNWTDAQLEALPKNGYKYELLDGQLIMSPVHANHGMVCMRIGSRLFQFTEAHKLGQVYDSSTGFRLSNDLLLSPDVSFVSNARLKKILVAPDKFLYGAPDLVVEVLSPSDRMREINRKLDHYFEYGTKVAWLVNWRKEQIILYTPDSVESLTRPSDTLTGGTVLPGFRCKLRAIFQQ
jgi:Uma2 family endonuclease